MTLSVEQQQALDELLLYLPPANHPVERPSSSAVSDLLNTWLGLSPGDLKAALAAVLGKKDALEQHLRFHIRANPLDAAFEFVAAAAWAFYQAEKDKNSKINTYIDAFYYIATCISVGYADMFAVTQAGRAIAGLAMIVGPALASKALDAPMRAPETVGPALASKALDAPMRAPETVGPALASKALDAPMRAPETVGPALASQALDAPAGASETK